MEATTRTIKLLANYDRLARAVRLRLLDHYPAKLVWGVIADARQEFTALIPTIPSIGQGHVWQFNLDSSVMELALYRSLKKYGCSLHETVQMTYDIFGTYLMSFPFVLRHAFRLYYFSTLQQSRLRQGAVVSQLRRYPEDWVFEYVEGDGVTFNFGVDIRECAILKFYQAHKAGEFTSYLCVLDHAMGKMLGLGFNRQGTLANGAALCDCRWKLGAETQGWPPVLDIALQQSYSR